MMWLALPWASRRVMPALLEGVNRAIAAAIEDGSMDQFVEEATTLAAGNTGILVDGEIVAG